ncbi:MAG: hypothetical protein ACFFB2_17125 [Promethearchaeota archaeon]
MADIHQVIVRNTPETGLDVVATTLYKSQTQNISLFLPEEEPSTFNTVFLTKFQDFFENIIFLFTFDDGTDHFGRQSIKTHTLIVKKTFYNEKTPQYFISPLINGSMNRDDNRLLKLNDFEMLDSPPISSKFIELILCKKHMQLTSRQGMNSLDLIQIFGTVDRIIPPPLNQSFSFQTMVSPRRKKVLKPYDLVFSSEKLPHSQLIEQIQQEKSEFQTIQAIADSISDLSMLRKLQQQLFLRIPEKWLSVRIQWRFGIKKFAYVRENLVNYFS